jgi:hypothetical protein
MKKLLLLLLSITYLIAITPQEAILQTDIKYICSKRYYKRDRSKTKLAKYE